MAILNPIISVENIHVAVVEDNSEIRQGVSFIINSTEGFSCIAFGNAEEALEKIPNKLPEVVLMDINLPGINGIECTRKLKEKYPELQIMICSVYDDDDNVFNALEAGANGYIVKSAAGEKLLSSIRELHNGGSPMSSSIARKVVARFQRLNSGKALQSEPKEDYSLTTRENEILDLLAQGYRNKELAEKLFVSVNTIRTHVYNVYEKLHVNSRIEALNKTGRGYSK
ncbi:MAG: response regulator transcription factor [Flavobacteriales bacterium]|jgi:DNA-binding NarL/FixJ family response regulator|tara:strand:- start:768 stop:1448 length:681 start_codon:yes stop_codon:yes gene_type:complete